MIKSSLIKECRLRFQLWVPSLAQAAYGFQFTLYWGCKMSYQEQITATFNKALAKKLSRELRASTKGETKTQGANAAKTAKRRHMEDLALAKEVGCTINELIK